MNWININVEDLDSEEFLGAEPVERATWLCLMRYCVGQENGGRIEGAKDWKDRKWQQVVRITQKEASANCDLWTWEGANLVVTFYPIDKENEVRTNRMNGAKGGRPTKKKPAGLPKQNHPVSDDITERLEIAETERNRKGIGKEMEGEEEHPLPPNFDEVMAFAKSAPLPVSDECAGKFFDEMEATQWTYRGQPCVTRRAWHARFRMFITAWNQNEQGRSGR